MVGPTEFVRGGNVIETERLLVTEGTGTGVPEGDGALGRLFLFSAKVKTPYDYNNHRCVKVKPTCWW
jgi:hypothetical protein